jgi:hypothetical protein
MYPFKHAFIVLLGVWILAGCNPSSERLTMVTPRLEIDQEIAEAFAHLFSDEDFVQIELVPNPNPELPGIHLLKSGAADLALVANTEAYDAELTTVVPLYPTVLHILYRADRPIVDSRDLMTDRTVYAGPPGSPSRQLLETTARRDGIAPEEISYVDSVAQCSDVIVIYAAVMPDIPDRIRDCGEYRLFSLGDPQELGTGSTVDSVTLLNPKLKAFVIPKETYGEMTPEPVVTLAVDKLLVARHDVPDTVIYDLLGEVLRLKPALSAEHPGLFHQLTDDFDISGSAFVLHPGAMAYLQRDEPDIYERYSGVAEVVVTLMIGLVSGIYAVFQIFSIRRKNRIDAFCQRAIGIRDGIVDPDNADERRDAIAGLKALQDQAYDMLIHEKLAADESFRIFISLCNDIIADLSGSSRQLEF